MGTPVTFRDFIQSGRANAPDTKVDPVALTYNANFAAAGQYDFNLRNINEEGQIGLIRTLFLDNGANPSKLEVWVRGTDQFFTVPASATGYFPINAMLTSVIEIYSAGGASDVVTVSLLNWKEAGVVWYSYGPTNINQPNQVQGAMLPGDNIGAAAYPRPVYIGGRDAGNIFRGILVDNTGAVVIAGTVNLSGAITIADGGDVTQGAKADAAVTNPASSASVIALLKGILTGINSSVTSLGSILTAIGVLARPTTGNKSTVAGTNVSTTILAANASRQMATIYNDSTAILYLALSSGTASVTSYTVQVPANGYYEVPGRYTGIITGVWASSTGNARVTEIV